MPKAIFFGMDDTILAEDVVSERCWQQVWVDFRGKGLPEDSPICPDRIVRSIVELIPRDEG